jgi:hypothetical protein
VVFHREGSRRVNGHSNRGLFRFSFDALHHSLSEMVAPRLIAVDGFGASFIYVNKTL